MPSVTVDCPIVKEGDEGEDEEGDLAAFEEAVASEGILLPLLCGVLLAGTIPSAGNWRFLNLYSDWADWACISLRSIFSVRGKLKKSSVWV